MMTIDEREQERSIVTPSLRLRFRWIEDRWTHTVEIGHEGAFRPIAYAVEAHPERDDPARVVSPTYQDLHLQRDGDAALALAVGRFGPHHFSASFRAELQPNSVVIRVDIADRCRRTIEALAATYRVAAPPTALVHWTEREAGWSVDESKATLTLSASRLAVAESGRSAMLVQAGIAPGPGPGTHRLLYEWRGAPLPATGCLPPAIS